jgi:ABC-type bacteriocin/lantibiotic exporter with double-glycine peptidase domain
LKCQQGKIYIDDYDVNDLDAKILQRYIGFVTQKAILFNTTIAENIKLGREEISEDQVIAAAKIAQIHDFIDELPLKYKTEIGTDAMKISGGQQQRITWARAIAAKPSILILDEATSNVDRDTAVRMFRELEPVMKDKTTIFISHQYYPELPIHTKIDLNEIN